MRPVPDTLPPSFSPRDAVTVRSVLLPTDFSECSAHALRYAIGIAGRYEAQLCLFHCVNPTQFNLAEDPEAVQTTCDDARRSLEKLAAELSRQYGLRNSDVRVIVSAGTIAGTLPQVGKDFHVDLTIIGTHGRTGWKKLVLGSVAEQVMDRSPCPVLSVAPSTNRTRLQEFGPRNILLAAARSDDTGLAKSYALSLARKYGSRLSFVDVLEDRAGRVLAEVSDFEWYETTSTTTSVSQPKSASADVPTEIGTQSDLILRVADERSADLIILAVPAKHRVTDRFLSTNSYRVVCGAHCPVLTVRTEAERDW